MDKEDKDLLLKYLCMALPYGVIVDYKENEFELPHWKITTIHPETFEGWIGYNKRVGAGSESGSISFNIGDVKPYLRPMSSMTEKEKEELKSLYDAENVTNESICFLEGGTLEEYEAETSFVFCYCVVEWLLEHHFDFMGLIPKGCAIEVTKENNPYNR